MWRMLACKNVLAGAWRDRRDWYLVTRYAFRCNCDGCRSRLHPDYRKWYMS